MDHKKTVKFLYDETAKQYDKRYKEIQNVKYKLILEKILIRREHLIIDVGCGTGNLFLFLEKNKSLKIGIDFSIESLKQCQKKIGLQNSTSLICADIDFLPFKKSIFNFVFVITLLQNVPNAIKSLGEIKRICKDNGYILLSLLKKKYKLSHLQKMVEEVKLKIEEIIDFENCEDLISIIKNKEIFL